jgi:hypothetical protein
MLQPHSQPIPSAHKQKNGRNPTSRAKNKNTHSYTTTLSGTAVHLQGRKALQGSTTCMPCCPSLHHSVSPAGPSPKSLQDTLHVLRNHPENLTARSGFVTFFASAVRAQQTQHITESGPTAFRGVVGCCTRPVVMLVGVQPLYSIHSVGGRDWVRIARMHCCVFESPVAGDQKSHSQQHKGSSFLSCSYRQGVKTVHPPRQGAQVVTASRQPCRMLFSILVSLAAIFWRGVAAGSSTISRSRHSGCLLGVMTVL